MNPAGSKGLHIREAFYVVLATFTLYLITLLIVSGHDPLSLLLSETSIVLPAILYVRIRRHVFRKTFRLQHFNPVFIILGLVIGFGFSILTSEINFLLQQIVPMQQDVLEALTDVIIYESAPEMAMLLLTFVLVAGIGEEMLFRGFLLGALEKSVDATRAVFYSAVVFTFMHFNPWWTVEIFFLGVIAGALTCRSDSLVPAIAVHMMVNLMALLLTNDELPFLQLYLESGHVTPMWLMVSAGCVVGGIVLFYLCSRKVNRNESIVPTQSVGTSMK